MSKDGIGGALGVGVILDALFNSADLLLWLGEALFIPMAVTSSTIAPNIEWLDQGLITSITVVVAVLYVLSILEKRYKEYKNVRSN